MPDDSFDLALSEYGASVWADPYRWIPEAARLLRPGGRLVFLHGTPLAHLCYPDVGDATTQLQRPYFGLHSVQWTPEDGIEFQLTYGDWIRSCETPASRSSAWSSCRRRRARRGTSTTRTMIPSGAGAGPRRRFGSPASAPDSRVDEPAAQSDPRAARDPVRGRPARLRRGRPAGGGPDRARDEARGGQGALRRTRTAGSRSVSTPPSCSTAGSTASPGMPTTRPGCCGSSRDARTRWPPACACSAPARTWSPTS